jgi:hypothetical protein
LKVTDTPPSDVASGIWVDRVEVAVPATLEAINDPKMETIDPGAAGPSAKLAPCLILSIRGACAARELANNAVKKAKTLRRRFIRIGDPPTTEIP